MTTFGEQMKALMKRRGISLRQLAVIVKYDKAYLSRISNDKQPPSMQAAEILDETLGANGELASVRPTVPLVSPPGTYSPLTMELDSARHAMDRILGQRTTTHEQIEHLEEQVLRNARHCVVDPPVDMLRRLIQDFTDIHHLFAQRHPSPTHRCLGRIGAQTAALVADELMVLGAVGRSWAWHRTARTAADETEDRRTTAHIRTLGAMLPLYYGDPQDSVALASDAQDLLEDATDSPSAAMAPALEAFGLAQLGDATGAQKALGRAVNAFESLR